MFNNKLPLLALIMTASFSQDLTFNSGWNLVGVDETDSSSMLMSDVLSNSNITNVIYQIDGGNTVNRTSAYFPYIDLEEGKGYWIYNSSNSSINITLSGNDNVASYMSYITGWNLVSIDTQDNFSNLATLYSNYGITFTNVIYQIDGGNTVNRTSAYFDYISSKANKGYWINVSSIDYDLFIPNALPNESTDLPSIDQQTDLNNHSMITAKNVSDELKFYLTSVDGSNDYKKVELSSFSASTLNSSDSDINSTVSSQVSAYNTGVCGSIVYNSQNNMTVSVTVDGSVTSTHNATYNGSDGNFTIGDEYEKVVWYGDAIDLSSVTNCQTTDIPFPPPVPNM